MGDRAERWVRLGRFGRPHGVRGAIRLWPFNPDSALLARGRPLHVGGAGGPSRALSIVAVQASPKGLIVRFEQITTRDQAGALTGSYGWADRADFPALEAGEYYLVDVLGIAVRTVEGRALGRVVDVQQHATVDTFVVRDEAHELLIPDAPGFVERLDLQGRELIVRPVEGLLELATPLRGSKTIG